METRANLILVGLFTVLGLVGALGFFVWLAKIEIDRQYAYYDIVFESVSGLDRAADVRFSGLSVGQVIALDLYPDDPSKVMVRIEIAAETPVKVDTKAQLQSQGVTGVAFVSLAGGSPNAPLLLQDAGGAIPVIEAERSVVQALTADAPDLLAEAVNLMRRLEQLASDDNQIHFSEILTNLADTTELLPPMATRADTTMAAASQTLARIDAALIKLEGAVDAAEETLATASGTFDRTNRILDEEAAPTIADLRAAATQFETAMASLASDIPAISAELKTALETAVTAIDQINTTVAASAPPFRSFAETGLPQYTRLARETRDLVESLKRLTARMERDPARFFFGNNVPELRR